MDIATVNTLPYEDFVNIFGNVVEKCPIVTAAVWSRRPFVSFTDLEAAINEFIDALPESGEGLTHVLLTQLCFHLWRCLVNESPVRVQVKRGSSGVTQTWRAGTSRAAP